MISTFTLLAPATAWMPYGIGNISLGKTRSEKLLAYCKVYALNADADLSEMWTILAEPFANLLAYRVVDSRVNQE